MEHSERVFSIRNEEQTVPPQGKRPLAPRQKTGETSLTWASEGTASQVSGVRHGWNTPSSGSTPTAEREEARSSSSTTGFSLSAGSGPASLGSLSKGKVAARPDFKAVVEDFDAGTFTDEYDISQDDPQILHQVQRLMALKAKRDARIRADQASSSANDGSLGTLPAMSAGRVVSLSSVSTKSSPRVTFPSTTHRLLDLEPSQTRDVDFSPSVGSKSRGPIPRSSDGGQTLDWSSYDADLERVERRWALSITKRRASGNVPTPALLEVTTAYYNDKLERIAKRASQQTIVKAAIVREQLRRRYAHTLDTATSTNPRHTLLDVARWYETQDATVKTSLNETEPLTWLKHLYDRRGAKLRDHSSWNLSALIIEEYGKAHDQPGHIQNIGELPVMKSSTSLIPSTSPPSSQLSPSRPRVSPRYSYGNHSHARSLDAPVSFGPKGNASRNSLEPEARRFSGARKTSRYSQPLQATSPHSSFYSLFTPGQQANQEVMPPRDDRPSRDLASRLKAQPRRGDDSDGGVSSGPDSFLEDRSRTDEGAPRMQAILSTQRTLSEPRDDIKRTSSSEAESHRNTSVPPALVAPDADSHKVVRPKSASQGGHAALSAIVPPPSSAAVVSSPRSAQRHRGRLSVPLEEQSTAREQGRRERIANELRQRAEYDRRAQILDDVVAQNQTMRHIRQHIGAGVREFEQIHSKLMSVLGMPEKHIPHELLDAFTHDPSAVTGPTRRLRGYKAVEDIFSRTNKQRDTFNDFLALMGSTSEWTSLDNVLDEPLSSLMESLEELDVYRADVKQQTEHVTAVLAEVKPIHSSVRAMYNDTLAHISVVYPELSYIIGLEESYKDRYQQLWDLGMDALTVILDTVTPFWRVYGKVIGQDAVDFLVIPLYRNEFTGEAKRYPLKQIPSRSFRHWVGLLVFVLLSTGTLFLQIRFALTVGSFHKMPILINTGLWWPAFPIFWSIVLVLWCAVLIELCICIAEAGVVVWWLGWSLRIFS